MAPRCLAARVALLVCLCSPGLAQQDCRDHPICKALVKKYSCTDTAAKMGIRSGKIAKPSDELRDICCKSCQAKSSGAGSQEKDKDMCKDQVEYCDALKGQPCNKDTSTLKKGTTLQQLCPRLCPDYDCGKKRGKERLKLVAGGNPACWGGIHTFERCCDQGKSPRGNPECFSAKTGSEDSKFTFDVCCPAEGKEIACVDDPWFGNKHGDCTQYGPQMGRDGKCVEDDSDLDSPLKKCPVSCGICQTKPKRGLKCWGGKFTFRR